MLSFFSPKNSPQANQDVLSQTETVKLKTTAAHFLEQLRNDDIKSDVMLKLTECNDAQFNELLDLLCEKNLNHLIKSLTIKRCGLTKIPEKIGHLHQLQTLKLHENQICKIPNSLTQCTQLDYLNLSANKLQSLPEDIDKLQHLRDLTICENLIKKLPESLSQCHSLKELYISHNLIEALPIDIGQCPLEILDADENQLQYLPKSIFQCSELRALLVATNQLSYLPQELGRLKKLEKLHIGNNGIEELPDSILECSELSVLNSTKCKLKMLPQRIDRLTKLEVLGLGNNQLQQLPNSICKLQHLRELYVWQNQLTSLPQELGRLKKLEKLHIGNNGIEELPDSIFECSELRLLDSTKCKLKMLPQRIDRLTKLEELALGDNQLQQLPDSICKLQHLRKLYVWRNQLTSLPQELGRLKKLEKLQAANNGIEELPDSILECSELSVLYLTKCKLQMLPQRIDRLTKLEELALGNNQLQQLPDSICKLRHLKKLYVWRNQLTSLPDKIGNCPLVIFQASNNHLKTLPSSLSQITTLDNGKLTLEGNQLVSLPALKNPLALTSDSIEDIQANSKRVYRSIQDMATAVVSSSYQDIVAGCAQPLIATRHDGTLERTYLTSTKTGATKLWPKVKSGSYDIARGGLHTSIGLGKTFVLTTSALAINAINLSATILDMFTSFLTMQFVTLSYCTTLAAKGIVIDPMLMLYNLIQYANDEDFVEPQLAPQSLSTWYQEHIQSILQYNESGFEAHQLAHDSKARHFSCIAALVDLIVCEAHIFTKTAAKAVRATLRAGHTIQRLSGHGLNHTAHGALLMGQGSAKLAAILVTLASIPLKVAVTEGTILVHERCHNITFEDTHSKLTQNLEDSLMSSSVGYQTPMVSA